MVRLFSSCALILSLLAHPLQAYETRNIFSSGAWNVEVEIYSDGSLACAVHTDNRMGDRFDITVYEDGQLKLFFLFGEDVGFRSSEYINVELHVDYEIWTLNDMSTGDSRTGASYLTMMLDPDRLESFVTDLMEGNAVALKEAIGSNRDFASWSLRGSKDAMLSWLNCFLMISAESA